MKKHKIRFLILLAVLAVFILSTAVAENYSGTIGNGITWVLKNNTLTITGSGEMTKKNSSDATFGWYDYRSYIQKVVIKNGITSIGANAFSGCSLMKSISIPSSVTKIYDGAFNSCEALKTISLPASLTMIDENAFCYCSNLEEISIPSTVTSIGSYAFLDCTSLKKIYFKTPSLPASLDNLAFYDVTATAYYPVTWSSTPTSSYGGSLTWTSVVAPIILKNPAPASVEVGFPASFTVAGGGIGLTYQWQVSTDSGSTWSNSGLSGNKTAELTLDATNGRNGYLFRCIITDCVGKTATSTSAKLTVLPPDVVIGTQPKSVTVYLDKKATFSVAASSTAGYGLSYQWQASTDAGKTWKDSGLSGNKTDTLTVDGTLARNGYRFRCVVTNTRGTQVTSSAAKLTVKEAIRINAQPASQKITKESNVVFNVTAASLISSTLSYQWQVSTDSGKTWSDSGLTGNKTANLTVAATAGRNGYRFRCIVKDKKGNTMTSSVATLTTAPVAANAKFTLKSITASRSVLAGNTVKYTINATSKINSTLSYQWQVSTDSGKTWKTSSLSGNKTKTLTVSATAARNGYRFRCLITDAKGNKIYTDPVMITVK